MASLKKRGKYYYIKFHDYNNGDPRESVKSLGIKYKKEAESAMQFLERLYESGRINPFANEIDPKNLLKRKNEATRNSKNGMFKTCEEAKDLFLASKNHLSPKSLETYDSMISAFLSFHNLENYSVNYIKESHLRTFLSRSDLSKTSKNKFNIICGCGGTS